MLNRVTDVDDLPDAPTFDETRHASICMEVRCLQLGRSFPYSLVLSVLTAKILVCRNYSGSKQALDRGQFRVGSANEGARTSYDLEKCPHSLHRYIGTIKIR